MTSPKELTIAKDYDELKEKLAQFIVKIVRSGRTGNAGTGVATGRFTVALSGASMINLLTDVLPTVPLTQQEWKSWLIFFVDERIVPFEDSQSSFGCYTRILLPACPFLSVEQFVPIDPSMDATSCAQDYELRMKALLDVKKGEHFPHLDLTFLGFGPDGHTASLFPGHPLLEEKKKWIGEVTDSPKPPPNRITFTLPLINSSKNVVVVSTGVSKAEVVKAVFKDDAKLPINMISLESGQPIDWIIDSEACKLLN